VPVCSPWLEPIPPDAFHAPQARPKISAPAGAGLQPGLLRAPPRALRPFSHREYRVPPHLLGRVSTLDFFVSLALMPVSMALAGPAGAEATT